MVLIPARPLMLLSEDTDILHISPKFPQQKTAPERGGQNGLAEELGRRGLAQRLYQADEAARTALIQAGVLREIAGRFSGLGERTVPLWS